MKEMWKLRKLLWGVFTYFLFAAGGAHRRAFFTILIRAKNKLSYLMPRLVHLYTFYLMDYKRSVHDAHIARARAAWEKENPDRVVPASSLIPVSENIRRQAAQIFAVAYRRIRDKIADRELLYQTVVAALVDYNDRFGETCDPFDAFQEQNVKASCDRILQQTAGERAPNAPAAPEVLPSGFVRDILDALDSAVRYKCRHHPSFK